MSAELPKSITEVWLGGEGGLVWERWEGWEGWEGWSAVGIPPGLAAAEGSAGTDGHCTTHNTAPIVGSTDSTDPSNSANPVVAEKEGHVCWLCLRPKIGDPTSSVADLTARLLTQRLLYFKSIDVVPNALTHLVHIDNLILLCANCHHAFDSSHPSWVMLQTLDTMNRYILHEQRAGRQAYMETRADKGAVQYQPYFLSEGFPGPELRLGPSNWPKVWGGKPTAAIIKASLGNFQPCEPQNVSRPGQLEDVTIGVPGPVATKCANLITSSPPPLVIQPTVLEGTRWDREGEGSPGGGEGGTRAKDKGKVLQMKARIQAVQAVLDDRKRCDRKLCDHHNRGNEVMYGPQHTSNDAIAEAMARKKNNCPRNSLL